MVRVVIHVTLTRYREMRREMIVCNKMLIALRDTSCCVRKIYAFDRTQLCLTRCYCMLCRSSILAEVQNSGNNKLPSNKNVLVLGKYR